MYTHIYQAINTCTYTSTTDTDIPAHKPIHIYSQVSIYTTHLYQTPTQHTYGPTTYTNMYNTPTQHTYKLTTCTNMYNTPIDPQHVQHTYRPTTCTTHHTHTYPHIKQVALLLYMILLCLSPCITPYNALLRY